MSEHRKDILMNRAGVTSAKRVTEKRKQVMLGTLVEPISERWGSKGRANQTKVQAGIGLGCIATKLSLSVY